MNFAVTGGSGFVGQHLLRHQGFRTAKSCGRQNTNNHDHFIQCDLFNTKEMIEHLKGVDSVIHAAGLAHVDRGNQADDTELYNKVNFEMTRSLLNASVKAGVKHFIYLSTIKVLGESSKHGKPFSEKSLYSCENEYARSKRRSEEYIRSFTKSNCINYTIIRPPMVYGENVKGNMRQLLRLVDKSVPLPIANLKNKRSLLAVDNLVDFIWEIANNTAARNKIFCVSDGEAITFDKIISELTLLRRSKTKIFAIPDSILSLLFRCIGKSHTYKVISTDVEIDNSYACAVLDWMPQMNTKKGFKRYYG